MQSEMLTHIKQVSEIRKELVIGGGDCDLYLDIFIDGKLVESKKSDSLIGNFLNILYLQMNGRNYVSMPSLNYTPHAVNTPINISSLSAGASSKYRATLSSAIVPATPTTGSVSIHGIAGTGGSTPLVNGLYTYTRVSNTQIDITNGANYDAGFTYTASSGSARLVVNIASPTTFPSKYSFSNPIVVVGTGTTAVELADSSMVKEMQSAATAGRLTYNIMSVNADSADATSNQQNFSRTFTNQTASSITVNEVGMYANYGADYQCLILRDLSTQIIGVGSVLTVSYRIKSTLGTGTDPGGFIINYARLLYRQFGGTSRAAIDVGNTSRLSSLSPSTLKVVNAGGETNEITSNGAGTDPAWKQGIVVGTGNTAVSEDDYFMTTVIPHGTSSGQMLYYGGMCRNFITDGSTYVSFDIVKAIENNSGGAITVKEIGLVGGGDNTPDDASYGEYPLHLFLIARNVLTTPVAVPDGNVLIVKYTIKVIL